jgi:GT2 family glycosyltransferase
MRLVVIIPAYGRQELTTTVVGDIAREAERGRESVDVLVVDNQGGYTPRWKESVLRPGRNLGWLDGCNSGLDETRTANYDAYILLNNDVRLSPGFFHGLARAQKLTKAGLIAPSYDANMLHQRMPYIGPAAMYRPKRRHWKASMVDGTCLYIPAATLEKVGVLDTRFNPHGWGAEIDYAFRVWDAGLRVVITGLAFMNHQQGSTSESLHGKAYHGDAWETMTRGLIEKYGGGSRGWGPRSGINPKTETTDPLTERQRLMETVRAEAHGRLGRS